MVPKSTCHNFGKNIIPPRWLLACLQPHEPQAGLEIYLVKIMHKFSGLFGEEVEFWASNLRREKICANKPPRGFQTQKVLFEPELAAKLRHELDQVYGDSAKVLAGSGDVLGLLFPSGLRRQIILNFLSSLMFL